MEAAPPPSAAAGLKRPTTVERAFELARSGEYRGLPEIIAVLKSEHHEAVDAHLAGRSIRLDLRRVWERSQEKAR